LGTFGTVFVPAFRVNLNFFFLLKLSAVCTFWIVLMCWCQKWFLKNKKTSLACISARKAIWKAPATTLPNTLHAFRWNENLKLHASLFFFLPFILVHQLPALSWLNWPVVDQGHFGTLNAQSRSGQLLNGSSKKKSLKVKCRYAVQFKFWAFFLLF